MKIVVDSNIVFSAILNTKSNIGQLIINGSRYFDFYSVGLLREEVLNHKEKITDLANCTEEQFATVFQLITGKIVFVDDILLKDNDLAKAIELVSNVDEDDALFVALSNRLTANLWTGDKRLVKGLKKKGYSRVITTNELYDLFLDKQMKSKRKRK